jgi:8-oxo-dGTP pyrophosphatase MutT (NUDIX family)
MAAPVRPAATVVVMRDGPAGPEILMLKRSGKAGFFPDAWVFPGGRVDASDSSARTTGAVAALPPDDTQFAVAAIRECFEEAGVWLGKGTATQALRDGLNQRQATLADAPDLIADLGRMALWSWWITPEVEPKRYDTRFFVAHLTKEEAAQASHDEVETVQSLWITPADALGRATGPEFFLAPPTFRTLEELADFSDAASVMEAAPQRTVRAVMPRLDMSGESWAIVLPGDPSYPSDEPVDGPTRIEFRQGRWWSHS